MDFLELQILKTADGSTTLFIPQLNETYHSRNGAVQESEHVFIRNGFEYFVENNPQTKEINILEVGLGTGLNAFLTLIQAEKTNKTINYYALEAFPPPKELITQLNYSINAANNKYESIFWQLHICDWEKMIALTKNFNIKKHKIKLENFCTETRFDIIYFDAFAPQVQPELWTQEIFEKLYMHMRKNALLTTYCAKGQVRRNMQAAGFLVERLAGPPGKREILRATKIDA